ncbi:hypothetical protein D3C87_1050230 [compost metagenome]
MILQSGVLKGKAQKTKAEMPKIKGESAKTKAERPQIKEESSKSKAEGRYQMLIKLLLSPIIHFPSYIFHPTFPIIHLPFSIYFTSFSLILSMYFWR